jgi:hypothetical protein
MVSSYSHWLEGFASLAAKLPGRPSQATDLNLTAAAVVGVRGYTICL